MNEKALKDKLFEASIYATLYKITPFLRWQVSLAFPLETRIIFNFYTLYSGFFWFNGKSEPTSKKARTGLFTHSYF